jgi:WD40 repeat protein
VTFSPDGTTLASGERGRNVAGGGYDVGGRTQLWDVRQRIALGDEVESRSPSEFSPDGRYLASVEDYPARVVLWSDALWTTDVQRLRKRICTLVGRSLTHREWNDLVGGNEPYHETCPP